MWLVAIGVVMVLMQLFGIGPVGSWTWADDWLMLLLPFALAVAWWTWCDATGYTRRKAMERDDQRKQDRINRHLEAIGQKPREARRR